MLLLGYAIPFSTKAIRSFLKASLLLLALYICACSKRPPISHDELLIQRYALHYGTINSPQSSRYLMALEQRLSQSEARDSSLACQALIANSAEVFAMSDEYCSILISKGLILALTKEAELAFVLAHEMAHHLLGHKPSYLEKRDSELSKRQEQQADLKALSLIASAGYDPRAGLMAISKAHYANEGKRSGLCHLYPDIDERIYNAAAQIQRSSWRPPGLVSTRGFNIFKRELVFPGG